MNQGKNRKNINAAVRPVRVVWTHSIMCGWYSFRSSEISALRDSTSSLLFMWRGRGGMGGIGKGCIGKIYWLRRTSDVSSPSLHTSTSHISNHTLMTSGLSLLTATILSWGLNRHCSTMANAPEKA